MRSIVFLALVAATLPPIIAGGAEPTADKALAQRISSHIQKSGQLRNYRIGVTCNDGVAVLAGTVASAEQRETAIQLAEQINGVSRVDCNLELPGESPLVGANNDSQPSAVTRAYGNDGMSEDRPAQQPSMQQRNAAPMRRPQAMPRSNMPLPAPRHNDLAVRQASAQAAYAGGQPCPVENYGGQMGPMGPGMGGGGGGMGMQAMPAGFVPHAHGRGPSYDNPSMPGYAWPSYASYPNYAAVSYPQQYSPTAWPYIGPFYPYPQVPLAWRKVSLEWDDGWWFLDFSAHNSSH
jgi:BON domain